MGRERDRSGGRVGSLFTIKITRSLTREDLFLALAPLLLLLLSLLKPAAHSRLLSSPCSGPSLTILTVFGHLLARLLPFI